MLFLLITSTIVYTHISFGFKIQLLLVLSQSSLFLNTSSTDTFRLLRNSFKTLFVPQSIGSIIFDVVVEAETKTWYVNHLGEVIE